MRRSSLGGFYATALAEEFGCRAVLLNPAIHRVGLALAVLVGSDGSVENRVVDLPPGFKVMASNDACPIAGMADEALDRGLVGRAGKKSAEAVRLAQGLVDAALRLRIAQRATGCSAPSRRMNSFG